MKVIVLLGPPAVGKGTQAKKISTAFHIPIISTGQIARDFIKYPIDASACQSHAHYAQKIALQQKLEKLINNGDLVPDLEMQGLLSDRIASADCAEGFILDGFPRTYEQAFFLSNLEQLKDALFVVIEIKIDIEVAIQRIASRMICNICSASYNDIIRPKIEGECDYCHGTSFSNRADDKEQVVRTRFQHYYEKSRDIVEYYMKLAKSTENQYKFLQINGLDDPDSIFDTIYHVLKVSI